MVSLRENQAARVDVFLFGLFVILSIILAGCVAPTDISEPTSTMEVSATETVVDMASETPPSLNTPTESEPDPTSTPSPTLAPTQTSTSTETPLPTTPPTLTVTATALPDPTEWAKTLLEIHDPPRSLFAPGQSFIKTWRLRNIGKTTWTKDYELVFVSGSSMGDQRIYGLPMKVPPKESVELTIRQKAPQTPGQYIGNWMLRNSQGDYFGLGSQADQPLTTRIRVLNVDPDNSYDFVLNVCDARWWNGEGLEIRCPNNQSLEKGFVQLLELPLLERSRSETRPALWVKPNNKIDGKMAGKYPPYLVQEGDHFRAQIGCLANNQGCNLTFKLQYQIGDNPIQTLETWDERFDGNITKVDVDLSPLVGQDVQFILRVLGNNNQTEKANGFWLIPRIMNVD